MTNQLKITAGIAGALLLGYGIWHFTSQYRLLKKTCFSFGGYNMLALNKDHLKLEVDINVKNLSDITLDLLGYEFDIYINNYHITKVFSKEPVVIQAQGFSLLKVVIDINPQEINNVNFLSGILLNYQNAVVQFKGHLTAKAGGILGSNIPFNAQSRLLDMIPKPGAPASAPCV